MKFKVGDKVKFLNEKGGGVVSRILSAGMVYVATEDGFELPTATGDIILLQAGSQAEKIFTEDFNVDLGSSLSPAQEHPPAPAPGKVKAGAEETPGFYLAFVPTDQKWFITGAIEVRLVNHSRHDILYNIILEDGNGDFSGFDYGSVASGESNLVDTIERERLSVWTDGLVQIMVHDEAGAYLPVQSSFHIKASKFSSEGSYQDSGLLPGRAILYKLAEFKACRRIRTKEEAASNSEPQEIKAAEHKKETLIGKHATGPHAAVVDLHIGEIVDNIAGLSSHDMFLLQINYFIRTLESAIANNFRKVTYIHGIGNGVLKNAIIKKLKEYEGLENKSASLADYGQGAVDVLIHFKANV